jgi:predicted RNase H-like HicB family nuclease
MRRESMTRTFTLEYWKDKKWYVGRLKGMPGVFSQGKSLAELKDNIRDAYELMVEESDEAIPHQTVRTTKVRIAV